MTHIISRLKLAKFFGFALLGLSLHAAPSVAAVHNLGTLTSSVPFASVYNQSGIFADTFNFTLAQESDLSVSLVSLDLSVGALDIYKILGQSLSLTNVLAPATVLGMGAGLLNLDNLAAGNYSLQFSGNASGMLGGVYLMGLVTAPVPEPEQWMLLSAGLLALGGVMRRRV